jgi:hypothetical protein
MLLFHVDDLKSSHVDPRINDEFEQRLQGNYGQQGEVVTHHGKANEYLGMDIDYTKKGKVIVGMTKYVEKMINDFPRNSKALTLLKCLLAMTYLLKVKDWKYLRNALKHTT